MNVLLADIGNSSIKLCIYELGQPEIGDVVSVSVADVDDMVAASAVAAFAASLDAANLPVTCYLASVNDLAASWLHHQLSQTLANAEFVSVRSANVTIDTDVQSRDTLGVDRLLAAYAAHTMVADDSSPIIVIDAGTAVTIDLVDAGGVFQGGVIFPGLETSFSSLRTATAALPDVTNHIPDVPLDSPIGKSTDQAIVCGVVQAQVAAITTIVESIEASLPANQPAIVVATGGSLQSLRGRLPDSWTYESNLVLHGIARLAADRWRATNKSSSDLQVRNHLDDSGADG